MATTFKTLHAQRRRCAAVLVISSVQVKYFSRSDLVERRPAYDQMVKPLTRLKIQLVSRFGVNIVLNSSVIRQNQTKQGEPPFNIFFFAHQQI